MIPWRRLWRHRNFSVIHGRRLLSSAHLDRPIQSYISSSRDPYLNLSIEHYLLQKSSPESAILLLYIDRPSVIIGRNQNPWLEANLSLLKATQAPPDEDDAVAIEPPGLGVVDLVRRRSGGGTVFHDGGNVNWTVISPSAKFTRDKHAEMVVRALRRCGVERSRVNERHDIVLDQGRAKVDKAWGPDDDTHSTPWQKTNPVKRGALKVSGSAYKLTRGRALHHGTALLNSPNLNLIPHYLHSPGKPFITARGVESVSSPVGNILIDNELFIKQVQEEFGILYGQADTPETVDEQWLDIDGVRKGYEELKSHDWTYLQTPQFTISNRPSASLSMGGVDTSKLPQLSLTVRNGAITGTEVSLEGLGLGQKNSLKNTLRDLRLHEIQNWHALFHNAGLLNTQAGAFVHWLEEMLPTP